MMLKLNSLIYILFVNIIFNNNYSKITSSHHYHHRHHHHNPHINKVNVEVFVQLFEWKWNDIAKECERYLSKKGYYGVQVSPPNEHSVISEFKWPWWQRYQPVSYKLISRSGNLDEFKDMVQRCNKVGVGVYVDAIINHMSSFNGTGSANSSYNGDQRKYPQVPYAQHDFNDRLCYSKSGNIDEWDDPIELRNCKLWGLPDLATRNEYVREKIVEFLNSLIDIGVAGFRFDAAKHIWPEDLINITKRLNYLNKEYFGDNQLPFIYQEVSDDGSSVVKGDEYYDIGYVTEFRYAFKLTDIINKDNGQKLKYLRNFGEEWGFLRSDRAFIFIDNHDTQRKTSVLDFFQKRKYIIANAFMLSWTFGLPRIMSSYLYDPNNIDQGPPSNEFGETKDVIINDDGSCGNDWICEHRWNEILNMIEFRKISNNEPVLNWWDNGNNQIAFSRGNKAFIAINNENCDMDVVLSTNLAEGYYCDIISGYVTNNYKLCTGKVIYVDSNNNTNVYIQYSDNHVPPLIAIHTNSKLLI